MKGSKPWEGCRSVAVGSALGHPICRSCSPSPSSAWLCGRVPTVATMPALSISSTIQYQFPTVSTATGEPAVQRERNCRILPGSCATRSSHSCPPDSFSTEAKVYRLWESNAIYSICCASCLRFVIFGYSVPDSALGAQRFHRISLSLHGARAWSVSPDTRSFNIESIDMACIEVYIPVYTSGGFYGNRKTIQEWPQPSSASP